MRTNCIQCRRLFSPIIVIIIVTAIIFLVAVMVLFSNNIHQGIEYNSFLKAFKYNYAVTIDKSVGKDDYAFLGNVVSFSPSDDLSSTFNAVVLMQNGYDGGILNDGRVLKEEEIAISKNILYEFNIKVGDTVYSKNKVNNTISEYKIVSDFAANGGIQSYDSQYMRGTIIIGYDRNYDEQLNHSYLYFYKDDYSLVPESGALISGNLVDYSLIQNKVILQIFGITLIQFGALVGIYLITTVMILSKNRNRYHLMEFYGESDIHSVIKTDFLIILSLPLFASVVLYLALSAFFSIISPVPIISLFLAFVIGLVIAWLIYNKKYRRKTNG